MWKVNSSAWAGALGGPPAPRTHRRETGVPTARGRVLEDPGLSAATQQGRPGSGAGLFLQKGWARPALRGFRTSHRKTKVNRKELNSTPEHSAASFKGRPKQPNKKGR